MSTRPVNLKDVAAKAGVSITTVSHVINKTRFVKPETAAAVERLQDENFRLKGRLLHMINELSETEAQRYEDAGSVLIFHEGLEADQVRKMADAVMQKCAGCCAVFSRNEDGSYKYAMGEIDGDLRQYTKEMNAALNGRGGGKPFFVQGSVQATEDEIRNFFEK